jgi:hypothetical protein
LILQSVADNLSVQLSRDFAATDTATQIFEKEYLDLNRLDRAPLFRSQYKNKPQYSDAILSVFTNKNNPNFRVKFVDLFPVSVSTILFNSMDSAENIAVADATFRFAYYEYERI